MESLKCMELRQAVMTFTNLVASTTRGSAVPMDIGALGGGAIPGAADPDGESDREPSHVLWALDEAGWPIDEEGLPIDGQFVEQAGQLNFVKGKGKGYHNRGDLNHYIRDCPKPRKAKGNGKGKCCHK